MINNPPKKGAIDEGFDKPGILDDAFPLGGHTKGGGILDQMTASVTEGIGEFFENLANNAAIEELTSTVNDAEATTALQDMAIDQHEAENSFFDEMANASDETIVANYENPPNAVPDISTNQEPQSPEPREIEAGS